MTLKLATGSTKNAKTDGEILVYKGFWALGLAYSSCLQEVPVARNSSAK